MRRPAGIIGSWVATVALLVGGLAGLVVVDEPERVAASEVALPGTPAGQQLEWVLGALVNLPPEEDLRAHFNARFLTLIAPDELLTVFRDVQAAGPYTVSAIEASFEHRLVVIIEGPNKRWRTGIAVEEAPPHLIAELRFMPASPPPPPATSWAEVDQRLRGAAPEVGFLAAEIVDGACRPVHAIDPDAPLSLGSAFKLYVLGAAAEAVRAGRLKWDTPIEIREAARVHTSMRTESMESGRQVPLQELARHMIEVSDNTATDLVLEAVGRRAVESVQAEMGMAEPQRNMPFLSTREMSVVKFGRPPLVDEYLAADVAGRRALLEEKVANRPAKSGDMEFAPGPVAVETVEWFASASDLCRAHVSLQAKGQGVRQILGLNPGVPFGNDAAYVGFKGGSEPGVLAGSWYVEHRDGRRFAISVLLRNRSGAIDTEVLRVAADAFRLASG